jgi:Domain of unknown function (DUF4112)
MKTRIEGLRRLQWWLDEAFRVPGTSIRVGWDPIIGLVPWAGDLLTALLSCAIVFQAHQMRLPRIVQLRMLMNVAIDLLIGAIPGVGDAADAFWKSNSMNMALLDRHAAEARPATAADWLFVVGVIAAILAVALLPLIMVYWLLTVLRHAF